MHAVPALALGALSCVALCAPGASQTFPTGKLWIVSTSGCPNVHFTTIGAAIDAASDGDVILVRPGSYAGFTLDGKSLAVVGDGGGVRITSTTTIQHVGLGQRVLLQGLGFDQAELDLFENPGSIVVEDCAGNLVWKIANTASAVLTRVEVKLAQVTPGASGAIVVFGSQVTLHQGHLRGSDTLVGAQAPGGAGLHIDSGFVLLVDCDVRGGRGGPGYSPGILLVRCTNGGPGGAGIELASAGAHAHLVSTSAAGGPGGPAGVSYASMCFPGPSGPVFTGGSPVVTGSASPARLYTSKSPVLERQSVPVLFTGEAADTAVLTYSFDMSPQTFPQFGGTLVPEPPSPSLVAGMLPANGTLRGNVVMPAGVVGPGDAAVLFAQGLFLDAPPLVSSQVIFIGTTHAWVVLDENHDPRDGCP